MAEVHAIAQRVGSGREGSPDASFVRLHTEDRGGAFSVPPGKTAIPRADLQHVAPPQPAQAVENTNLGPLGIKRVDHFISAQISRKSNDTPGVCRRSRVAF